MEFEPTMRYLIHLGGRVDKERAQEVLNEAIRLAELSPKYGEYTDDDFVKICKKLQEKGGRARIIGMTGITQMRCSNTLKKMTF